MIHFENSKYTYTVWVDYGREGWSPNNFLSKEDCIAFIAKGATFEGFRITKELSLSINE